MITAFYAALLGLMNLVLTCYVILGRWKYGVSLGDGGQKDLNRRIRAHGNFIETVPITLFLLFCLEYTLRSPILSQNSRFWIHGIGLFLLFGRVLHLYGLRQKKSVNRYRQVGMGITLLINLGLVIWLLYILTPQLNIL